MKLFTSLLGLSRFNRDITKKESKRTPLIEAEDKTEALIKTGRQQFKKLQELGLQIPIAVL